MLLIYLVSVKDVRQAHCNEHIGNAGIRTILLYLHLLHTYFIIHYQNRE